MQISVNLLPKKRVREYIGLSPKEEFIGAILGSVLGVALVVSVMTMAGKPVEREATMCEKLILLAETREDSLKVLTAAAPNGVACAAELLK